MLGWNAPPTQWSAAYAAQVFQEAANDWRAWSADLHVGNAGARMESLHRSALTVQLLSHAQRDSAVAALTTSLPERLGGERNYDYRYSWVRDASLSLSLLARMGKAAEVKRYLRWLCGLTSSTKSPLQVCYRLDGDPHIEQEEIEGVCGYENSLPVRRGNRAAKQKQLGSLGFFADCARIYLDHGGEWEEGFWELLRRAADFTCAHWQEKDSGAWELPQEAHYVASRVMSWVVLERAVYIAERTGHAQETDHWRETATTFHAEVMDIRHVGTLAHERHPLAANRVALLVDVIRESGKERDLGNVLLDNIGNQRTAPTVWPDDQTTPCSFGMTLLIPSFGGLTDFQVG